MEYWINLIMIPYYYAIAYWVTSYTSPAQVGIGEQILVFRLSEIPRNGIQFE